MSVFPCSLGFVFVFLWPSLTRGENHRSSDKRVGGAAACEQAEAAARNPNREARTKSCRGHRTRLPSPSGWAATPGRQASSRPALGVAKGRPRRGHRRVVSFSQSCNRCRSATAVPCCCCCCSLLTLASSVCRPRGLFLSTNLHLRGGFLVQ